MSWPHLSEIASELMPLGTFPVGLLIGYNCSRVFVPRDVIPAPDDKPQAPFAQKTDLGWSIVGVITSTEHDEQAEDPFVSHRIMARVAPPGHSFLSEKISVKEMFDPVCSTEDIGMSGEDHQFLKIMKDGICKSRDGIHYQIRLPFHQSDVSLPID